MSAALTDVARIEQVTGDPLGLDWEKDQLADLSRSKHPSAGLAPVVRPYLR